jgi:hypothetical protein
MMGRREGILIYKALTKKKEGQRRNKMVVERAFFVCNFVKCTRMDTKSLKRQLKFA